MFMIFKVMDVMVSFENHEKHHPNIWGFLNGGAKKYTGKAHVGFS